MSDEPGNGADSELDAALDEFLDGTDLQGAGEVELLPETPLLQRIGPGTVLGDFELLVRTLGTGSMGVVFEALQLSVPGRSVALKVVRNLFSSPRTIERFRREVAVVGRLDHPGIVPVLTAGVERGVPYYAMRLVHGVSCARLVRTLGDRREPPTPAAVHAVLSQLAPGSSDSDGERLAGAPPERITDPRRFADPGRFASYERWVAAVGVQLALALQHAHERGVVHRDVKPGNVLLTSDGRPMLVDFGLASHVEEATLTRSGAFLGTLAYAAPEQLRGEPTDARSDVYALGATLYELCSLRRPFEVETRAEVLQRIEREELAPLGPHVPAPLRAIVTRALHSSPRARYSSASALGADLSAFLAGRPVRARTRDPLRLLRRTARRHPRVTALAVLVLLALTAFAGRDRARARQWTERAEHTIASAGEHLAQMRGLTAAYEEASGHAVQPFDERVGIRQRDELGRTAREIEALLDRAEQELGQALAHVAGHGVARALLAAAVTLRVEAALARFEDVFAPAQLAELEARLRELPGAERRAALLDLTGSLWIDSDPPGAEVVLQSERTGIRRAVGRTPLALERVHEGAWVVELRAPGRPPVRAHALVRRRAVDARTPHPSRHLRVRIPTEGTAPSGFVYVPDGWAFVEEDPPRREHVRGFWIQRRETTFAEWLAWLNGLEGWHGTSLPGHADPANEGGKPRFRRERSDWQVRQDPDSGRWIPAAGVDPSWPVRGLTLTEMTDYALSAHAVLGRPLERGWPGLPTRAEWIRAARGAGGGPYPWGETFGYGLCANYFSSGPIGHEPFPVPVGSFATDRSVLGVRDLAGSVREATVTPAGQLRGRFLACGGSYRDTIPEALSIGAARAIDNEPHADVGFRMVIRGEPEWASSDAPAERFFRDDFERPDSPDAGAGWIELSGFPFQLDLDPVFGERCSIEGGALVCRGGRGNFSERSTAWRRVAPPPSGFVLRARVAAVFPEPGDEQACALALRTSLGEHDEDVVRVTLDEDGRLTLAAEGRQRVSPASPERLGCTNLEVRVGTDRVEARAWAEGDGRPVEPLLALDLVELLPPARYLVASSPHVTAGRLELEEIELAPAD